MTRRKDDPTPIGEVLDGVLDSSGLRKEVARQEVLHGWSTVVGEGIARVTEPRSLDRSVLVVEVRSSAWLMELNLMRSRILEKLREAYPDSGVRKLLFVLAENA